MSESPEQPSKTKEPKEPKSAEEQLSLVIENREAELEVVARKIETTHAERMREFENQARILEAQKEFQGRQAELNAKAIEAESKRHSRNSITFRWVVAGILLFGALALWKGETEVVMETLENLALVAGGGISGYLYHSKKTNDASPD